MRSVVLAVLVLATFAAVKSADACPYGRPCNKYKMNRMERAEPVEVYVRERPAAMPRPAKPAKVMALLTGSTWRARKPARVRALGRVRIFNGSDVPDSIELDADVSPQIVRGVTLEDGHFVVALGGGRYQVSPCRDRGRVTSCLVRISN
jgi:hypothetical protein